MNKDNSAQEKATLLVVMSTAFLVPFIGSALNLALPALGSEFHSSALLLSWVVTSYLLATAAFLLPFGRLADIFGRKKIFVAGLFLFSLSSFFCGVVGSIELLIAFRLVQGIGAAMIFSTSMAILTSVYPPNKRGKALGLSVAGTYIGLSMGPVLGGWMNYNLGWRSIFYLTALLSFMVPIYAASRLKGEWRGAEGEKFDLVGSLLYVLGLVGFLYGMSSISTSTVSKYIALLGLLLIVIFVRYELVQVHPLIEMRLFVQNLPFAFSNLATMINYSATFALGFLISLYLQVVMGHSSQSAGMILLAQPLIMALFSPLAGTLSDRIEARLVATGGMLISTIGIFMFVFLRVDTSIWIIMANLAFIGLGFALFSSPNTNAVMGSVQPRLYGIASSTLGTMRLVGQALSMALVTLLIAIYVGDVQLSAVDPEVFMRSIHTSFILFSILCFFGIFASVARGKVNEDKTGSGQVG